MAQREEYHVRWLIGKYEAELGNFVQSRTVVLRDRDLQYFFSRFPHKRFVDEYTPQDGADFVAWQRHAGASDQTIFRQCMAINAFFKWLIDRGLNVLKPCPNLKWPASTKLSAGRKTALTPQAVEKILTALERKPISRIYIKFWLSTGLEGAELVKLHWRDIDWNAGTVHVLPARKGGLERTIPVHPSVLADLRTIEDPGDALLTQRWLNSNLKPQSEEMSVDMLRLRWRRVQKFAGTEDCSMSAIRHYYATGLLHQGIPLAQVRRLLGLRSLKPLEATGPAEACPAVFQKSLERLFESSHPESSTD